MEDIKFLKLCGTQINKEYSGDPLLLKSFINSVSLLKTVAKEHTELLEIFVLSKLSSKALECVRQIPKTIDEIIEDLEKYIKQTILK